MHSFLLMLFFVGLILVVTDWLIGEEFRQNMREKVGLWWLQLEELSWRALAINDAQKANNMIRYFVGPDLISIRSIVTAIALWIISIFLCFWLSLYTFGLENTFFLYSEVSLWASFLKFTAFSVPMTCLSMVVTLGFLHLMMKSTSLLNIFILIILDIVFAVTFFFGFVMLEKHVSPIEILEFHGMKIPDFEGLIVYASALLSSMLPTFTHLVLSFVFLGSKFLRPIAKPIITTVLLRFYESKQGVLTMLAIGINSVAQVIDKWLKF